MTGISGPTQPIPIEALVVKVNQRLKDLVTPEKKTQVSRLTGKQAEGAVAYNKEEPLPPTLALKPPTAPGGAAAGYAVVDNMLAELRMLPSVRASRADNGLLRAQNLPAFTVKALEGYKTDGYQNIVDLQNKYKKDKDAFTKEFPLRAAYFEAVEALDKSTKLQIREVLPGPIDPKSKAAFFNEQVPLGTTIFDLRFTALGWK